MTAQHSNGIPHARMIHASSWSWLQHHIGRGYLFKFPVHLQSTDQCVGVLVGVGWCVGALVGGARSLQRWPLRKPRCLAACVPRATKWRVCSTLPHVQQCNTLLRSVTVRTTVRRTFQHSNRTEQNRETSNEDRGSILARTQQTHCLLDSDNNWLLLLLWLSDFIVSVELWLMILSESRTLQFWITQHSSKILSSSRSHSNV